MNAPRATIDFESKSACSLKKSGAWKYSLDPTTEVLCLAFRLPHWREGRTALWEPSQHCRELGELFLWWHDGNLFEAHNAWFERSIWTNIMVPRYGWPAIAHDQWRCSAAKAAAHALPRGLDDALTALRLPIRKDAAGAKVMMKMNKPRKPRKAEREAGSRACSGGTPRNYGRNCMPIAVKTSSRKKRLATRCRTSRKPKRNSTSLTKLLTNAGFSLTGWRSIPLSDLFNEKPPVSTRNSKS
jgi:hypothetical protein